MSAEYLVRRWRAFVAPSDLFAMSLLLSTGARFRHCESTTLPHSPAAWDVYNHAVHLTVDTWPYPNPAANQLSLLGVESPEGAVLDVLRIMDLDSGTTGQFVSFVIGSKWTSPTPCLVVKQDRWFCDSATLALYSPVGELPSENNTAAGLLRPILKLIVQPMPVRPRERKTLPWPAVTGMRHAVLEDTQRSLHRPAPTHHFTDPVWNLDPQAPGTDIMFDQIASQMMMYTEHILHLI